MSETEISPARLSELRAAGRGMAGPFVDPQILQHCEAVLRRRGEGWAASVLGRDLTRRSLALPALPFLVSGEEYTLVAADVEEDRARFEAIVTE